MGATYSDYQALRVAKAAFIVEMADGTRMVYEVASPIELTIDTEMEDVPWGSPLLYVPPHTTWVTVRGLMKGGRIWKHDMPTTEQSEIEAPRQEIER